MITAGTVRRGSASSIPVVSRPMLPIAVATAPLDCPPRTSMLACTTLPAAFPPGRTLAAAFPASCELAFTNQGVVGSVIRSRNQSAAMLPASSSTRKTNQSGRTRCRSGHWSSTAIRLGATT